MRKQGGTVGRGRRTSRAIRLAAARAVEQVMSSDEALELLVRRLEEAGWHVERAGGVSPLTPSPRPR